jgi:hypothetical protein
VKLCCTSFGLSPPGTCQVYLTIVKFFLSQILFVGGGLRRQKTSLDFDENTQDQSERSYDNFRPYESIYGVVRSANTVHTRVLGLYITKENIGALLETFDTTAKAQRITRDLFRLFKDAWIVTSNALEDLEYLWTGHRRENTDLYGTGDKKFCAVFTASAYFSPEWE